jgi:hypothetical protein
MRTTSVAIAAVAGIGILGACTPMAAQEGSVGSASCAGTCDATDDALELLYGERREVGPVGDFGITAEWVDHVEIAVANGARARLVLEPHGHGETPHLSLYRDRGTSVEHVADSASGALVVAGDGEAGDDARYLVEIHGAPEASSGAYLELECAEGECGARVDVTIAPQPLRDVPVELRDAAGDDWRLFRIGADREVAEAHVVSGVVERVALAPHDAERLASEMRGADASLVRVGAIARSEIVPYGGGDAALDAFANFLDPEGHRFIARYGEARVVYELIGPGGDSFELVQQIPVMLLRSDGADSDLAVALERLSIR